MPTVTTPNPKFRGERGGLNFVDGKATSDVPLTAKQRRFFDRCGYTIDGDGDVEPESTEDDPEDHDGHTVVIPEEHPERPAVRAGRDQWDTYASTLGIDTEGLSKEQVIQAVKETEGDDDA